MQQVKAKKALGQHFLTDLSIAQRIAASLEPRRDLPVLEIGPGMGVLTQFLLQQGSDTRVIEIDAESVAYLREHFPTLEGRIIEGDFLKIPIEDYLPGDEPFALIGNYPYNISSQIFFRLLDYRGRIPCCDEHVFNPPPKVKSGVIRLLRNERTDLGVPEALFKQVVKTGFNQRRKTLRNSLKGVFGADYTGFDHPLFSKRPEQLGVEEFITLTRLLQEHQSKA